MSTGGADVLAMLATVIVTITLAAYSTRRPNDQRLLRGGTSSAALVERLRHLR